MKTRLTCRAVAIACAACWQKGGESVGRATDPAKDWETVTAEARAKA